VIFEDKMREMSAQYLHVFEALLYIIVGALLAVAAIGEVFRAGAVLWRSAVDKAPAGYALVVLDQLLLVLMLVELLHTVRISVRSQALVMEPFLIVGLMASIRRVLVITMQAAKMTEQGQPQAGEITSAVFLNTMAELGLLGVLTLIFVFSIYLLRRSSPREELVTE
jgi:phosphate starvation-inducible membrane PsiE